MGGFGTLKMAGQALFISGLLHLPAPFLSGFSQTGWFMFGVAFFYTLLAMGLTRGMRAVGYLVFVCMLIGMAGGFMQVGTVAVPDWLIWAILAVDLVVVVNLFVALWRPKDARDIAT